MKTQIEAERARVPIPQIPQRSTALRPSARDTVENAILRAVPEPLLGLSRSGKITWINSCASAMLQCRESEAPGTSLGDLIQFVPEDGCLQDLVTPVLEGASSLERTTCQIRLNRPQRQILAMVSVGAVAPVRGAEYAVLSIRDITELDNSWRQYFRSRHLEGLQQLAGGLATHCMNLVTAVQGAWESSVKAAGQPASRTPGNLQRAIDATAGITRQLLAFSKRLPADPRIVDLNGAIAATLPLLEQQAGPSRRIALALESDLHGVELDPSHLEEILLALIRNTAEALPGGGSIRIATRNLEITAGEALKFVDVPPGLYTQLEVSDSGSGLSEWEEEHGFEPFFSTRPHTPGLGLASVYGLTKQAGGHIRFESSPREGSRFLLCWPCAQSEADLSFPSSVVTGAKTVLVIDNDRTTREDALRTLLTEGYHVLEAATASEAARVCRQWQGSIDLALVNMIVGCASGPEIMRQIRASRPSAQVLYMSSYSPRILKIAGAPGVEGRFIQKPFSTAALSRRVREIVDADGD